MKVHKLFSNSKGAEHAAFITVPDGELEVGLDKQNEPEEEVVEETTEPDEVKTNETLPDSNSTTTLKTIKPKNKKKVKLVSIV